jgi:hypothetical protein
MVVHHKAMSNFKLRLEEKQTETGHQLLFLMVALLLVIVLFTTSF